MHIKVSSQDEAVKLSNLLKDGDWMVLYYADWCGHCNTMKPEWKKVVNKMSIRNNSSSSMNKINLAEVESNHIGDLINKPQVDGFPTIKMYNNGSEVAKFEDERIADKIEKFALSNSRKSSMSTSNQVKRNYTLPQLTIPLQPKRLSIRPYKFNVPTNIYSSKKHSSFRSLTRKSRSSSRSRRSRFGSRSASRASSRSRIVSKPRTYTRMYKPRVKKTRVQKPRVQKPRVQKPRVQKPRVQKPRVQKSRVPKKYNIRSSTKDVFGKLIKSFKRIGKEADQDANILTDAKHLL